MEGYKTFTHLCFFVFISKLDFTHPSNIMNLEKVFTHVFESFDNMLYSQFSVIDIYQFNVLHNQVFL